MSRLNNVQTRFFWFGSVLAMVGAAFLAPALGGAAAEQSAPNTEGGPARLVGTWRLVSFKYGDAKDNSDQPAKVIRLKHVTPTHFSWVNYDAETKTILRAGGGRYMLKGDKYTEHLEYGLGDDIQPLIGKAQEFTAKVENDVWRHSGQLSSGTRIEEAWARVKDGDGRDGERRLGPDSIK
jgi:hypothetical protein